MIIRRRHWPLLIALCIFGPAAGLALGVFVEWPSCDKTADQPQDEVVERVEADRIEAQRDGCASHTVALPNERDLALSELAPGRPVAIVVMKGTWCPVCQKQLVELSDNLDRVQKAGGAVFGLTTAEPQANQRLMDKLELGFPVVSDADRSLHRALRLWDHNRGHAVPGVVFLDADGEVEDVHRGRYPNRPQEAMILERLEAL